MKDTLSAKIINALKTKEKIKKKAVPIVFVTKFNPCFFSKRDLLFKKSFTNT